MKYIAIMIVGAVIVALLVGLSIAIVPAGHRGVLLHLEKVDLSRPPLDEGLNYITPFIDRVEPMETRVKEYSQEASSASRDLQIVRTVVTVNAHLDPNEVHNLYKGVGVNYEQRIIVPAVQETVKQVTAKFNAEELITKRAQVKSEIEESIKQRLGEFNIIVDVVSIKEFDFSPEFNQAIERKQVAEQDALTAQNKVAIVEAEARQKIAFAEGEKQSAILKAEGDAEAIKLRTDALNELYLEWLKTTIWDGKLPSVFMSGNSAFPFIQIPVSNSSGK